MPVEILELLVRIGSDVVAWADSTLTSLFALYSAGMPRGLDVGGLAAGGVAGAAAGAGAAYGARPGTTGSGTGDGTTGGSDVGRNDRTRPAVPTSVQARRDAAREYDKTLGGQFHRGMLNVTDTLQTWSESIIGVDRKGTAPAGSKA